MASLGVNLTDSEGNLRDIIEVYTEIAQKVQGISDSERIAVTEGLAGKFHISRMQALLDDLASADSMYRSMYESSVNSAGSANEENERYMESLQARINLARVEVEKLALAMGDAFLTEGMIQGIKVFSNFLQASTALTEAIGALPVLFGVLGVAAVALSTRIRTLAVALVTGTATMKKKQAALIGLSTGLTQSAAAANVAGKAFKSFLLSTGAGIVLFGVGFAFEKIIAKMGESRQRAEELEQTNRSLLESYKNNAADIDNLSSRYANLSSVMENGTPEEATASAEEYYEVQSQLADLLPDLVLGEDEKGRKILANATAVNSYTKFLKQQLTIEKELEAIKKREKTEQDYEDAVALAESARKELEDIEKELKSKEQDIASKVGGARARQANRETYLDVGEINSYQQLEEAIRTLEVRRQQYVSNGDEASLRIAEQILKEIQHYQELSGEYNSLSINAKLANNKIALANAQRTNAVIDTNKDMIDSTKLVAKSISIMASGVLEETETIESFFDSLNTEVDLSGSLVQPLNEYSTAMDTLVEKQKEGLDTKSLNAYREEASTAYDAVSANVIRLAQDAGATDAEIVNLSKSLINQKTSIELYGMSIEEVAEKKGITTEEAKLLIASIDETGDASNDAAGDVESFSDALESLYGIASDTTKRIDEAIMVYEMLGSVTNRTAEEQELFESALKALSDVYPSLVANGEARIDNIRDEQLANKQLAELVNAAKDGQMDAEEMATLSNLLNTNQRIKNINAEIAANQKLVDSYASVYEDVKTAAKNGSESAAKLLMRISVPVGKMQLLQAELATATGVRSSGLNGLSKHLGSYKEAEKTSNKEAKESNKTKKESIYITDKYAQAIERLNVEIAKQNALQASYPEHSKTYQDAIRKELALMKQKKTLIDQQTKALENQIRTGKIQQTGTISYETSATTSSSSRQLSGWGGRQTSNYGWREHPTKGGRRWHAGVDIAGSRGQRLDSNVDGKVTFAGNKGNGFGNYVEIVDASGLKNIYAHLDSVAVKIGQQVTKGLKIGEIGSTGNSTGNHLHYEVRNSANKDINPMNFLQSAKGMKVSETVAGTTTKAVQTTTQAIDEARSQLNALRQEGIEVASLIQELEADLVNSVSAGYQKEQSDIEHLIRLQQLRGEALDSTSAKYQDTIKNELRLRNDQIASMRKEQAYLQGMMKDTKLSATFRSELRQRVDALTISINELGLSLKDLTFENIQVTMSRFDATIDDVNFELEKLRAELNMLDEGSQAYTDNLVQQGKELQKTLKLQKDKLQSLKNSLLIHELTAEQVRNITEQIEDLTLAVLATENEVYDLNDAIKASSEKMAEEAADSMIEAYKRYLEEKRDMHLKSLAEEMEAEDARHDKRMDNLNDEMEAFRKVVQQRLDEIDREENERNYAKEIDKLEEERLKILNKINLLSMDDSMEAKAERKKLQEELAKIEEDIAEKRHDKEIEDRKQSLNDMLTEKEEQIKAEEELENARYEAERKRIEDLQNYWQMFYDDQLNDERYFAQMKKDIVAGNFDALGKEFQDYIQEMKDTMPSLVNDLDGTMKAVGTSIRQNIIDQLEEALDLLDKVSGGTITGNNPSSGGVVNPPSGGGATSSRMNSANLRLITAKYFRERLGAYETNNAARAHLYDKADALAGEARRDGATMSNMSLNEILTSLNDAERKQLSEFLMKDGYKYMSQEKLQSIIKEFAKTIANSAIGLSTGGYIKDVSGGRLAMLHENEVVLNKPETAKFFEHANVLDKLLGLIPRPNMPQLNQDQTTAPQVVFHLDIENMNGTREDAMNVVDIMTTEWQRRMTIQKGMK